VTNPKQLHERKETNAMFSKKIAVSAAILLAAASAACSPSGSLAHPAETTTTAHGSSLDGRTYKADAVLPDGTHVSSDLSFVNGMFDSSACESLGFRAGAYTVSKSGDVIVFRAELKKSDGTTEVWTGRIDGDSLDGDCVGPDGTRVKFAGRIASR
jgi:hypothetical protein